MKLKIFTLAYDNDRKLFDDTAMTAFLADKEALSASEHFFVQEQTPVLAVLVTYRDVPRPGDARPARAPAKDWRAELDAPDQALYDALRIWRGRTAKRDGVAPYLICNNRQLADICRARPASGAALLKIEGLGDAKVGRWGEELLAVVTAAVVTESGPAGEVEAAASGEEPPHAG
jgi:superfamily II DNA helicase RecQ